MSDHEEEELDLGDDPVSPDSASSGGTSGKTGGLFVRAKKFISTKTANSSVGKKVIFQALGEEGERLFKGIIDAAKKFYGDSVGKKLGSDLLAIVLKVKILFDEEILKIDDLAPSEDLVHSLMFQAAKDFDTGITIASTVSAADEEKSEIKVIAPTEFKSDGPVVPTHLSRLMKELSENWCAVFSRMMQEKNVLKLKNLFDKFGNPDFLNAVLNTADYKGLKSELDRNFKLLMRNAQIRDPRAERTCRYANCTVPAVRGHGLFRSAGFCANHHNEHFRPILAEPQLQHFLYEEEQNTVYFLDFLKKTQVVSASDEKSKSPKAGVVSTDAGDVRGSGDDPMIIYNFLMTVNQWRSISSKQMRTKRAKIIGSKFLATGSTSCIKAISSEIRETLLKDLESRDAKAPRLAFDFFEPATSVCLAEMTKFFSAFLRSPEYERFVVSFTLPKEELELLKAAKKAGESKS